MDSRLATVMNALRLALQRERLPPAPVTDGEASRPPGPSTLQLIFGRESLPVEPERVAPPSRSLLGLVFRPEPLPLEPPAPPRPRQHWLAWLTKPEQLDQDR